MDFGLAEGSVRVFVISFHTPQNQLMQKCITRFNLNLVNSFLLLVCGLVDRRFRQGLFGLGCFGQALFKGVGGGGGAAF